LAIDETRSKLLEAAGNEFAEKGLEGATVRAICERAGVNVAAVNYHFGDKERLYEAVVMMAHQEGGDSGFNLDHGDPRESLRAYVHHFIHQLMATHDLPWHQQVMLREVASPTKASDTLVREAIRPQFLALTAILRRFRPEADERQIHAIGFSVIGQCLFYKLCRPISERIIGGEAFGRLDADYLADHITRFSLAALGHAEPFGGPTRTTNQIDASLNFTDEG